MNIGEYGLTSTSYKIAAACADLLASATALRPKFRPRKIGLGLDLDLLAPKNPNRPLSDLDTAGCTWKGVYTLCLKKRPTFGLL